MKEGAIAITELPVNVSKQSYWRVLIRPGEFQPDRIPTLKECWHHIESCRVSLRGWDYPHLDREDRANGIDWIASWCDFMNHLEYWRFYQSGQFVHQCGFWEHHYMEQSKVRWQSSALGQPDGFVPTGYIDVIGATYSITEVFEFAARLCKKGNWSNVFIEISMIGVNDHVLFVGNPMVTWNDFCRAREPILKKEWRLTSEALLSESASIALDACAWFFERFHWMDASRNVLAGHQKKLLDRTL